MTLLLEPPTDAQLGFIRKLWKVSATFDNQDQAKAAAAALMQMMPREYSFTYSEGGKDVWIERGYEYSARERKV